MQSFNEMGIISITGSYYPQIPTTSKCKIYRDNSSFRILSGCLQVQILHPDTSVISFTKDGAITAILIRRASLQKSPQFPVLSFNHFEGHLTKKLLRANGHELYVKLPTAGALMDRLYIVQEKCFRG
jgi:hypothetical protein